MEAQERTRLEGYLRKLLGSPDLVIASRGADEADLTLGGKKIGDITKDEDEGELSYYLSLAVPGGAKELDANERTKSEKALKDKLGSPGLSVRPRPRKTDSAEVYVGDEFIGTLSVEDDGYYLTMSILDIDLDGEE